MQLRTWTRVPFVTLLATATIAAPVVSPDDAQALADPNFGPQPGESTLFSSYYGREPPFPANVTDPIHPTEIGDPAPDDELWQNLLAAEWVVFNFYQSAVEAFNESSFADLGLPNTTYQRIMQIRDNEAGHLRIFQNQISPTSLKPGPCQYTYPYDSPDSFLAVQSLIEVASMAFLTGLVQEARLDSAKGALTAISQVETRHEVWALIDVWDEDPFSGPSDTVFPYAKEILDVTNQFVIPGSCPSANPPYPYPSQHLPQLSVAKGTVSVTPGSSIQLTFPEASNQPHFSSGKQYYAVFFHDVRNISLPVDTSSWPAVIPNITIPGAFEEKGVIIAVISDVEGATKLDSVVAGPVIFLQQPASLGPELA